MKEEKIALELAKRQREISIAEFFEKNRHLLGFDNKRKALLTTVKEAVDNSLDACEEAKILPEIIVELNDMGNGRFRVTVEDNGPGIIKEQIPKIFAKLLYGSKFYTLRQSRGQQGLGISAAVLYAQLTTGRPIKIISKISPRDPALYYELRIDTQRNKPNIIKEKVAEWEKNHGIKLEVDLEATYQKGSQSVDEYIKETAIINPHATIIYTNPKAEQTVYARVINELPRETTEIKPHPYGVELGILLKMAHSTKSRTMQAFFMSDFSRVGSKTAKEICQKAGILANFKPQKITREQAERLIGAIKQTKIIAPSPDCICPIGSDLIEKGIKKEINAEFYCSVTRPPAVYRGNPFIIEAAIAYGGNLPVESSVNIMRFANRIPLLYQQGACAITESIETTNWRAYGLQQRSIPSGPAVILVHIASVWVPYTSESKEAIAHYPEIIKEIKLALQECGRNLARYVSKKRKITEEFKKKSYIEKYLPHVGIAIKELIGISDKEQEKIIQTLKDILEKKRGSEKMVSSLEKFKEKVKNIKAEEGEKNEK